MSRAAGTMEATMTMRRPQLADRLWCRRLGLSAPPFTGSTYPRLRWWSMWVALLVPYAWRPVHRIYAAMTGFFWIPCPLCDRPFGGHESGGSIPDPTRSPGGGVVICSSCTRSRQPGTS
jgi:hypothetical protein